MPRKRTHTTSDPCAILGTSASLAARASTLSRYVYFVIYRSCFCIHEHVFDVSATFQCFLTASNTFNFFPTI